jgi:hypothetical protein
MVVFENVAKKNAKFSDGCTGARPGEYDSQCDLRASGFQRHLAQIQSLTTFLKTKMDTDFRLEKALAAPEDLGMEVKLDFTGLVDAIPYLRATPELQKEFTELRDKFHLNTPSEMTGNTTLCYTRAMVAAQQIRPRVLEIVAPVGKRLLEHPVLIMCKEEKRLIGPKYRGVRYTSVVFIRLPSHELASYMQTQIRTDPKIAATEVRLVSSHTHGGVRYD